MISNNMTMQIRMNLQDLASLFGLQLVDLILQDGISRLDFSGGSLEIDVTILIKINSQLRVGTIRDQFLKKGQLNQRKRQKKSRRSVF